MTVEFYNQWPAVFQSKKHHWVDFTFIKCYIECGTYKGKYIEIYIGFMGFNCVIDHYTDEYKDFIDEQMKETDCDRS